jgi:DNA (cytosine-5)-methyltransferase 1
MAASNATEHTVVDLFCGCGGFSLGAELAGFRSLAAIDIDSTLQSAYRRNFPGSRAIGADIAEIDASDWRQLIGKTRPDALIGGPPCQGFSRIGKRHKNDPRNTLIHHFYRQVDILRPKFFIMENVEGLLHDDSVEILNNAIDPIAARYQIIGPLVVAASHFGAATSRRRVVVVGYDPADVGHLSAKCIQPRIPKTLVTVREAISDLPGPIHDEDETDYGWAKYPSRAHARLSSYAVQLRKAAPAGLGWCKGVELHNQGFVSGSTATRHSREVARRYAIIKNGKTDRITKSVRLDWDGQCPTLRAGTDSERGAFQAVRPLHPGKGRVITVREAARLQGFPDWFIFHPTKWHSFRMLGNSVSPLVSYGIFERIAPHVHLALAQ